MVSWFKKKEIVKVDIPLAPSSTYVSALPEGKYEYAKTLADNPCLNHVLDNLERDARDAWLKSPPDAVDWRERSYYLAKAVHMIKMEINGAISSAYAEMHNQKEMSASSEKDTDEEVM